jgi:hypothetical protein
MSTGSAIAVAVTFVWLGMVIAISFLEAPLKFRAPGITIPLGLGIGRLVFRALNTVEVLMAVVVGVAMLTDPPNATATVALLVAILVLVAQVVGVRPQLTRRSDAVLARRSDGVATGLDEPRSHANYVYVGLELVKVIALLVGGIAMLAAV